MELKPLMTSTLERLELVRFALIIQQLESHGTNIYTDSIIETVSQLAHAKSSHIYYAREQVKTKLKPQPFELGLLNAVYRVPYRPLCKLGRHSTTTINQQYKDYLENKYQYPLQPLLDQEIILSVRMFLDTYEKLFKNVSYILKGLNRV